LKIWKENNLGEQMQALYIGLTLIGISIYAILKSRKSLTPLDRARLYLKKGKLDSAIELLNESVHLDKKQYEAYKLLADTYYQLKSFDKALDAYNKAIHNRKEAIAYFNRGITYVSLNQLDLAIDDVTTCLETYSGDKNFIYKELGYLYQMIGDQNQSKNYYNMIMKTSA